MMLQRQIEPTAFLKSIGAYVEVDMNNLVDGNNTAGDTSGTNGQGAGLTGNMKSQIMQNGQVYNSIN